MPALHCLPDDRTVPAAGGQTLLASLLQAEVPLAHACGGNARCSTCRVEVREGLANCAPRPAEERVLAERLGLPDEVRLSCRTRIRGDVTVRRLVLDREDEELVSQIGPSPLETVVGRELPLAVLFADLAGFTAFSEAVPAYDVVHLLNRWFRRAARSVEAEGGYVDNYIGDGLMALFGVDGKPDATLRAVRAGLALLRAAEELAGYVRSGYGRDFAVRVGIHHGEAVVGLVGACSRPRETAIGDTVNTASRIEAANKEFGTGLLLSEEAHAEVVGRVRVGQRVTAAIRGKRGEHALYEVLGTLGDP